MKVVVGQRDRMDNKRHRSSYNTLKHKELENEMKFISYERSLIHYTVWTKAKGGFPGHGQSRKKN